MNMIIPFEDGSMILNPNVSTQLVELEEKIKALKEAEEEIKKSLIEEMEKRNIIKLDTPELTLTYIASTDREKFDSKKLREDNPDLYDLYISMIPVKASVRIKIK